jgi:hypothetical protein
MLFFLTGPEEFLYIVLQLENPNFSNAFNIVSFILALLAGIHIVLMLIWFILSISEKTNSRQENELSFYATVHYRG